ncbi:hypothetical protein PybrP1_010243 [[Pythium] brassicae (nom. inval.)]|nr:hypothetical protein PybrP1_010243 [[Pythium] brassicae (nom. inval.)]
MSSSNTNYSYSHAGIRHLRAQGAFLYKRSTAQHLSLVAARDNVADAPCDRVTEAFGVENWPHLMHLLGEGDDALRKRVLKALADVFRQPQQLVMCAKFGALELIEHGVLADDKDVQELSVRVLSVVAESPCGRAEMMKTEITTRVLTVFSPAVSECTCGHLYNALISVARSFVGAQQLSRAGYLPVVLEHLKRALSGELELRALQLLKLLLNDGVEATVYRALEMDAMEQCARRLFDASTETRVAVCDAIGAMGYVDKAKRAAVDKGVVKKLCNLLTDAKWQVMAASAGALMSIAVLDDAKRAVVSAEGLQSVNQLLQSSKFLVQLNTLKLVTVLAAYPPARRALDVSSTEYHLRSFLSDADPLLARSAKLALQAVQWKA